VHLAPWPEADRARVDETLSLDMQVVRDVVALGLQARNANKLKVRQPLARVEVILGRPQLAERVARYSELLADELNAKEVVLTQDAHHVSFAMKPDFRKLGPVFGARVQLVKKALEAVDAKAARAQLAAEGKVTLRLGDGGEAVLDGDTIAVTVTPEAGWVATAGPVGVVILDAHLSPALVAEGRAREVLSRIQGWRKEADLDYVARIRVGVEGAPELLDACAAHRGFLASESLALELSVGSAIDGEAREADIDGLPLRLTLTRA
jgi:isoleucyl-tRNA synthetase